MVKTSIKRIIETSIVTAFTIAAALIWKDVITDAINTIIPISSLLLYKFIAAIIATIIIIIAMYFILKSEEEAVYIFEKINKKR